jgi:hypothetical protein
MVDGKPDLFSSSYRFSGPIPATQKEIGLPPGNHILLLISFLKLVTQHQGGWVQCRLEIKGEF